MTEPNYARLFFLATAKEGDCWHEVYSYEGYIDYPSHTGGRTERRRQVWYKCKNCDKKSTDEKSFLNPTFTNVDEILQRMREYCGEIKWFKFTFYLQQLAGVPPIAVYAENIPFIFILNPSALLKKAYEFIIKMKGEK